MSGHVALGKKKKKTMDNDTRIQVQTAMHVKTENLKLLTLQVAFRKAEVRGKLDDMSPEKINYLLDLARQENEMKAEAPIGEAVPIIGTVEKILVNRFGQKGLIVRCDSDEGTFRLMAVRAPVAVAHLEEGERVEFTCETKASGDPSLVYFSKVKGLRTISYYSTGTSG